MSHLYEFNLADTGYSMEDILEQNMGLVVSIVNTFKPKTSHDRDNYMQAGLIGLWKAAEKYDVSIGCKFSPFARNSIRWEIIKLLQDNKKQSRIQYGDVDQNIVDKFSVNDIEEYIPESLSEDERQCFLLRAQGLNFAQIATMCNRKINFVKTQLLNAIEKIKEANE